MAGLHGGEAALPTRWAAPRRSRRGARGRQLRRTALALCFGSRTFPRAPPGVVAGAAGFFGDGPRLSYCCGLMWVTTSLSLLTSVLHSPPRSVPVLHDLKADSSASFGSVGNWHRLPCCTRASAAEGFTRVQQDRDRLGRMSAASEGRHSPCSRGLPQHQGLGDAPDHHLPGDPAEAVPGDARCRRRPLGAHLLPPRALGEPAPSAARTPQPHPLFPLLDTGKGPAVSFRLSHYASAGPTTPMTEPYLQRMMLQSPTPSCCDQMSEHRNRVSVVDQPKPPPLCSRAAACASACATPEANSPAPRSCVWQALALSIPELSCRSAPYPTGASAR